MLIYSFLNLFSVCLIFLILIRVPNETSINILNKNQTKSINSMEVYIFIFLFLIFCLYLYISINKI